MKTIYKTRLTMQVGEAVLVSVAMKRGAKVVNVAGQYGHVCIWALVDTDEKDEVRSFYVVGTGCSIPDGVNYLGTALLHGGQLVAHVFSADVA